jgi:hypothetical protein
MTTYKLIYLARRAATVAREDWPRTWRSHAIFASQFPVLEAKIDWMRYCNRIDGPEVEGLPGVSTAHDGVSVASSTTLDALNGGGFSKEERALIDQDELRVFDRLTPDFSFFCTEQLLRDGPAVEIGVFRFLPRKAGMSREAFAERWSGEHARIAGAAVGALGTVNRYAQNLSIDHPPRDFPFDAISECWHADLDGAVKALADPRLAPLTDDFAKFCDMDRGVTMLTRISHRWPKNWGEAGS